MNSTLPGFFKTMLAGWLALAVITFIILLFVPAPYGRHLKSGWGKALSNRFGWIIMESPSALLMILYFLTGNYKDNIVFIVFLLLWEIHYLHRSFIFPFRFHSSKKDMPLSVVFMAIFFNAGNTFFNGLNLFHYSLPYQFSWLYNIKFITGVLLFATGFIINLHADKILLNLRKPGETSYKIPYGGMYRWVSCPNYFGELLEWTGWAIATWTPAGLSFAVWTFANLVPRAIVNHKWYKKQFPDYPDNRKAVIPYII
jgi:protein-S-isoprenylcysteine O-methyltransferase Ste14